MLEHWPGGEPFRQPPPCAAATCISANIIPTFNRMRIAIFPKGNFAYS
jgi:hypothetical protein